MAFTFKDQTTSQLKAKQIAQLYMKTYQYAAEDFRTIPDDINHAKQLTRWSNKVETRLKKLGNELKVHTHTVTPHTHTIAPHTHVLAPHVHVVTNVGVPSSPNLPQTTTLNTLVTTNLSSPLDSSLAKNQNNLGWNKVSVPTNPSNTTGRTSNIKQNKAIKDGKIGTQFVRQKQIAIANVKILTPLELGALNA